MLVNVTVPSAAVSCTPRRSFSSERCTWSTGRRGRSARAVAGVRPGRLLGRLGRGAAPGGPARRRGRGRAARPAAAGGVGEAARGQRGAGGAGEEAEEAAAATSVPRSNWRPRSGSSGSWWAGFVSMARACAAQGAGWERTVSSSRCRRMSRWTTMHDDRELVEERITRELTERVLPLVHPERRPLTVEAGPTLDEVVPFAVGQRWGPPWGTTWFRFTGAVPAAWSGRRVEALLDLGFAADSPGFQCEGLVRDVKGQPVQGIHPRRQAVAVPSEPGPVELVVEAASNPMFPQFRPSPLGCCGHGRHGSAVPPGTRRARLRRRRCRGAAARPRRPRLAHAHARPRRPAPGADPGGDRQGARRAGPRCARRCARQRAPCSSRSSRCERAPVPTGSSPRVTPTSTRRGCGRCGRQCASARARSPRWSP